PAADLRVLLGSGAHGDRLVRNIGNCTQRRAQLGIEFFSVFLQLRNLLAQLLGLRDQRFGILLLFFELRNLLRGAVALGLELLGASLLEKTLLLVRVIPSAARDLGI